MNTAVGEFYQFISLGASNRPGVERWNCVLRSKRSWPIWLDRLTDGKFATDWDPTTRFTPKTLSPPEDVPFCHELVVSDRLRKILERHAPNQVQYLPVRVMYNNKPYPEVGEYWVANLLHVVDCRDPVFAESLLTRVVIIPERVPEDIAIFRPQGYQVVAAVRRSLRDILVAENVTGANFWDLKHIIPD